MYYVLQYFVHLFIYFLVFCLKLHRKTELVLTQIQDSEVMPDQPWIYLLGFAEIRFLTSRGRELADLARRRSKGRQGRGGHNDSPLSNATQSS